MSWFWFCHKGTVSGASSLWARVSLNDKCLWVYDLWRQKATSKINPACVNSNGWKEGGLMTVWSHMDVFILQYLVCKRLESKKKGSPADPFQGAGHMPAGRDQYKLMANQLRASPVPEEEVHELIVRIALWWCPRFLVEIERGGFKHAISSHEGWIQTVSKWKDMLKVFHVIQDMKVINPLPPPSTVCWLISVITRILALAAVNVHTYLNVSACALFCVNCMKRFFLEDSCYKSMLIQKPLTSCMWSEFHLN